MKLQDDLSQVLRELHGEQAELTEIEVSPVTIFEIGSSKGRVVGFENRGQSFDRRCGNHTKTWILTVYIVGSLLYN